VSCAAVMSCIVEKNWPIFRTSLRTIRI
jgi:hypothetical protein